MKIIQAPMEYERKNEIACFLAGGCASITWREETIKELEKYNLEDLVIYDPYNINIESHFAQVQWEFKYLNNTNNFIFSAYFDKYTNQPITMYELGRAIALSQQKKANISLEGEELTFLTQKGFPVVVSYHKDAPLKDDLKYQCGLTHTTVFERTPKEHAEAIAYAYKQLKGIEDGNN